MKVVVYTAIFGNKDEAPSLFNKPEIPNYKIDFICITDNPNLQTDDYQIKVVPQKFSDVTKNARSIKINGFKGIEDYDIAIWHDSSVILDCSKLQNLVAFSNNHYLSVFKHGNDCIYAEARDCINHKKDNPLRIAFQMLYYGLILHFPLRKGVFETTMMVTNVKQFNGSALQKQWWKHVRLLSRRDQLALPVAQWKSNSAIGILKGKGFNNPYSQYRGHRYYHYKSKNPLLTINNVFLRKVGLWIIFKIEKYLTHRQIGKSG